MNNLEQYYRYSDGNIIDWTHEANGIIDDISMHVKEAFISEKLASTGTKCYFNLTTLGEKRMCVKIFQEGLQIVGDDYDKTDKEGIENERFETPYALLSEVCHLYINSFGNALTNALGMLEKSYKPEECDPSETS